MVGGDASVVAAGSGAGGALTAADVLAGAGGGGQLTLATGLPEGDDPVQPLLVALAMVLVLAVAFVPPLVGMSRRRHGGPAAGTSAA